MKTVILNLEPHDDILSVLDRLGWVKGHRALLIWPAEGCGLESRLDFVRLARRARALNLSLALVSEDPQVTALAAEVGLPAFATREEALRRPWVRRRRRRRRLRRPPPRDLHALREAVQRLKSPWPRHPLIRLGAFTAAVLAVFALLAFLLPGATITLTPQATPQEVTLTVRAAPDITSVALDGRLPARWLEVTVSGEDEATPTGHAQVPYRAATAVLRFTNLTDQTVEVPEGTLVFSRSDPDIRFAVQRGGTVPPGAHLTLTAQAVQPGSRGNRPVDDLQGLDPPLAFRLRVTNPYPATGGQDWEVPAPTEADRTALRRRLETALAEEARQHLQAEAKDAWLILPSFRRVATLEEIFSAQAGEPANNLHLSLRQVYSVLVVEQTTLETLARQVLDARLVAGQAPVPGSLSVEHLSTPTPDPRHKDGYHWRVRAARLVVPRIEGNALRRALSGMSPAEASAWLTQRFALRQPPQIRLQPPWWPRLPWFAARIQLQVKTPEP